MSVALSVHPHDNEQTRADTVRDVLSSVRASGRTALTAPEAKIVCDAYDIPLPQEARTELSTSRTVSARVCSLSWG